MSSVVEPSLLTTASRTTTLEASWIGSVAFSRLHGRRISGRIHSVYKGAVNILLRSGIVSLVPEWVGRGPINLTMHLGERDAFASADVQSGGLAEVRGGRMILDEGKLRIYFGSARTYSSPERVRSHLRIDSSIRENLESLRQVAISSGHSGGLAGLIPILGGLESRGSAKLNDCARVALPSIVKLVRAINRRNLRDVRGASDKLVGFGPGLTPSSDDMLIGMMLMMSLHSRSAGKNSAFISAMAHEISSAAKGRTTALSQEYVEQASLGNGNERITKLCEEVLSGDQDSVRSKAREVLLIGETSGTDTVLGMLLGGSLMLCEARS